MSHLPSRRGRRLTHCLLLLAWGCQEQQWEQVVTVSARWSDDDREVLVDVHRFELSPTPMPLHGGDTTQRNSRYELWRFVPNVGSGDRVVSLQGQLRAVYFMRSAGYIYYETWAKSGLERQVLFLSDGMTRALPPNETPRTTVPAPNGAALVEVIPCIDPSPVCDAVVTFRDPHNGEILGPEVTLRFDNPHLPLMVVWTDESRVIIADQWSEGGTGVSLDGTVEPGLSRPTCYSPATSSSEFAEDGRVVSAKIVDDEIEIMVEEGEGAGFPRRCWPWE